MILGVNHVSISVPDMQKALDFYCGQLGFENAEQSSWKAGSGMSVEGGRVFGVTGTGGQAAHLRGPNLLIELFHFTNCQPKPQDPERAAIDHGITHFCLAVQDVRKEYARLKAAGMRFISEPVDIAPGLVSVYGRDPFGNIIEFEEASGRILAAESALTTVKRRVLTLGLGVLFPLIFAAVILWQTPGLWRGPLSAAELDGHAAAIEQQALPAEEKAARIAQIRAWAAQDDGKAVLLVKLPGQKLVTTPSAEGTVVLRAPSRRTVIERLASPALNSAAPNSFNAADVALIPLDAAQTAPDLRWSVGGLLLIVYLLVLWLLAVKAIPPVATPAHH